MNGLWTTRATLRLGATGIADTGRSAERDIAQVAEIDQPRWLVGQAWPDRMDLGDGGRHWLARIHREAQEEWKNQADEDGPDANTAGPKPAWARHQSS